MKDNEYMYIILNESDSVVESTFATLELAESNIKYYQKKKPNNSFKIVKQRRDSMSKILQDFMIRTSNINFF